MMAGSSVPEDVVEQLQQFHEKLTRIEDSLEDYFCLDSDNLELLETLDRARIGLMTLYAANSLYWVYLCTKGQRPMENESVKAELERIKEYMSRLKSIEDKVKAPKLNPKAAKAFVRNALFEPEKQKQDAEAAVDAPHVPACDDSTSAAVNTKSDQQLIKKSRKRRR